MKITKDTVIRADEFAEFATRMGAVANCSEIHFWNYRVGKLAGKTGREKFTIRELVWEALADDSVPTRMKQNLLMFLMNNGIYFIKAKVIKESVGWHIKNNSSTHVAEMNTYIGKVCDVYWMGDGGHLRLKLPNKTTWVFSHKVIEWIELEF